MSATTRGWCHLQPQSVGLLQGFAGSLGLVALASLATGVTDARRSIRRDRESGALAVAEGGYGLLAPLTLAGLTLCPRG
ncbi:MAG: hypothetical protein WAM11_14565 [Cyanobium sp.]